INSRVLATTKLHVTVDQAMRAPVDRDADGLPDWIITRDLESEARQVQGTAYYDLNRNNVFDAGDRRAGAPTITLSDREFAYERTERAAPDGTLLIGDLPPGTYAVRIALNGRTLAGTDLGPNPVSGPDQDVSVPYSIVHGFTNSEAGDAIPGASIEFKDETNGTVIPTLSQGNGSYRVGPLLA